MEKQENISVLIVDDHEVVRQGLVYFLESQPGIVVAGQAASGIEAIEIIPQLNPDVVLMDLVMPEMDGIETTRRLKEKFPEVKVLALTTFIDEDKVTEALRAGMTGYLMKDTTSVDLARAIRSAVADEIHLSAEAAQYLAKSFATDKQDAIPPSVLTDRQQEILILIARGLTNQDIAEDLSISIKTVKVHVSNIFEKLNLSSRTQAAIYAMQHKLVE